RARRRARSMAEGLGDFAGGAASDEPPWFDHSLQLEPDARGLDPFDVHCARPEMLDALFADDSAAPYDPYPLGSVLAGALWESAQAGVQLTARGVIAALPALGAKAQSNGGRLSLADVLDVLVATAADERKAELCGLFPNRFLAMQVKASDLPSCSGIPATAHAECQ